MSRVGLDLVAQVVDMRPKEMHVLLRGVAPHLPQEFTVCDNVARLAHQDLQELKLGQGETHLLTAERHPSPGEVNEQGTSDQTAIRFQSGRRLGPAEAGPNS